VQAAIYSAIYGAYDLPKVIPPAINVPCIMFTDDRDLVAPGWEIIVEYPPMSDNWSPMMKHKWYKLHPTLALPGIDVSMWLDGSMTILVDDYVDRCLQALGNDHWVMVRHPIRCCIYDEAIFSAHLPWYDARAMLAQVDYYRSIGFPARWGLAASGANVRRHCDIVANTCEHWWYENLNRSHQDQLSLPVMMWLMSERGLKWNWNMPWHAWWHISDHLHRGL